MPQTDLAIVSPIGRGGGVSHGGITPLVLNLVRAMCAYGVAVDLLCFYPEGEEAVRRRAPDGVNVRVLPAGSRRALRRLLREYLRAHPETRIMSAGHRFNDALLHSAAAENAFDRVTVSVHNTLSREMAGMSWLRRRRWLTTIRRRYTRAASIIAVSRGVADDLIGLAAATATRMHVIYNPIITADLQTRSRERVDHPWLTPGQPPVVIGVGRLEPQKDFGTLIRAVAAVKKHRNCRLIILGEGRRRGELEQLVAKLEADSFVDLPGFVDNPQAYVAKARVFALSSAWEGFGNVIVEALAVGTPVVATDCPSGPSEILDGGRYGTLVPVGDSQAMAKAIEANLTAPPRRAPPEAVERFRVEACARQYLWALGIDVSEPVTTIST